MLPHGYLYRVKKFEQKKVDSNNHQEAGKYEYYGAILELLKDNDPMYQGEKVNRKNVFIPYREGGVFLGFALGFKYIDEYARNLSPKSTYGRGYVQCSIVSGRFKQGNNKYIGKTNCIHEFVCGTGKLVLVDVEFEVKNYVLSNDKTGLSGWVEIDPHPIHHHAVTNIPRPVVPLPPIADDE